MQSDLVCYGSESQVSLFVKLFSVGHQNRESRGTVTYTSVPQLAMKLRIRDTATLEQDLDFLIDNQSIKISESVIYLPNFEFYQAVKEQHKTDYYERKRQAAIDASLAKRKNGNKTKHELSLTKETQRGIAMEVVNKFKELPYE